MSPALQDGNDTYTVYMKLRMSIECALLPYPHIALERQARKLHLAVTPVREGQALDAHGDSGDALHTGEGALGAKDDLQHNRSVSITEVHKTRAHLRYEVTEFALASREDFQRYVLDLR